MKKFFIPLVISIGLMLGTTDVFSQPPTPPGEHGGNTNAPADGGAPIGGGLFILLGLGAAYGGRKLYLMNKEELED